MGAASPQLLPPGQSNFITRVSAYVRLGRGVVGNTTFGFWGACLVALGLGIPFILTGHPKDALFGSAIWLVGYFVYQIITWIGVGRSPDPGVTGDQDYAQLAIARLAGAQHRSIMKSESPIFGTSVTTPEEEESFLLGGNSAP